MGKSGQALGSLTFDKFIVDFDFDILEFRDVAVDIKDKFEMLCVFDNPTPLFSANEVSDMRDPYIFDSIRFGMYFGTGTVSFSKITVTTVYGIHHTVCFSSIYLLEVLPRLLLGYPDDFRGDDMV